MAKMSLADAAFAGDEKEVARILAKSTAEVGRQDEMGFTPLHWAADHGHERIARMLIDAGASPDAPDIEGLTPLHFACFKGRLECARIMIPIADLDIADCQDNNALGHALRCARISAAGYDVERGGPAQKIADLLAQEPARRAALAQAAELEKAAGAGAAKKKSPGL